MIRRDSLTVAGAVPEWPEGFTGFPFHPASIRHWGTSAPPMIRAPTAVGQTESVSGAALPSHGLGDPFHQGRA
jgi:hypothetical protein